MKFDSAVVYHSGQKQRYLCTAKFKQCCTAKFKQCCTLKFKQCTDNVFTNVARNFISEPLFL